MAVAPAIARATGVRVQDLPLTPEQVRAARMAQAVHRPRA